MEVLAASNICISQSLLIGFEEVCSFVVKWFLAQVHIGNCNHIVICQIDAPNYFMFSKSEMYNKDICLLYASTNPKSVGCGASTKVYGN